MFEVEKKILSICAQILELIENKIVKFKVIRTPQKSLVLEGWMGGWKGVKASFRIAYSNQEYDPNFFTGICIVPTKTFKTDPDLIKKI